MFSCTDRDLLKAGAVVLAVLLAAGCARESAREVTPDEARPAEPAPGAPGVVVNAYDCADGERVVLEGLGREAIRLHRAGERATLGRVDNEAEYTYAGDELRWTVHGADAELTLADQQRVRCGESPAAAVWEEARLRGVTYRAEGLDQSWELELRGRTLAFRHRDRNEPLSAEGVRWAGETPLEVSDDGVDLRLEPVGGDCDRAEPSLEPVRLIVEDRLLAGCGRFLDDDRPQGVGRD